MLLLSIPSPHTGVVHLGPLAIRMYGLMLLLGIAGCIWLTGVRWVADLRDSIVAKEDRAVERRLARLKEQTHVPVARLVAGSADGVVAVTETIAAEIRELDASARVAVIPNGCDPEDFEGLEYRRAERFRITHTGSFFGKRDPRPFLEALARMGPDVTARFIGDFRPADRAWAARLGLGDRLELRPFSSHADAIAAQRDSDALLLLLPGHPVGLEVAAGRQGP